MIRKTASNFFLKKRGITFSLQVDILCEFSSLNGGEHSMLVLLPLLQERGITFRVLAPPEGALAEAVQTLGAELVPFNVTAGMPLVRRQELLAQILERKRPDILHANSLSAGRLSGSVVAAFGLRGIVHLRDIIRLNPTSIADLNKFQRILAVSVATKQFHISQGLCAEKCFVMYNGVDLQQFRPFPRTGFLHRELHLSPDIKLLAVIGQIGLRKGQDQLLESLKPVFESRNDIHLLIVGRRWSEKEESLRFEQQLRDVAAKKPFQNRIHFLGIRTDIPQLLNELTLLVHPARQEPLGRVLLEAAACGAAMIATEVGGTSEIFPDSEAAKIVPITNFADAVENLLESSETRKRYGNSARQRAETVFSHKIAAENLFQHYEAVLKQR